MRYSRGVEANNLMPNNRNVSVKSIGLNVWNVHTFYCRISVARVHCLEYNTGYHGYCIPTGSRANIHVRVIRTHGQNTCFTRTYGQKHMYLATMVPQLTRQYFEWWTGEYTTVLRYWEHAQGHTWIFETVILVFSTRVVHEPVHIGQATWRQDWPKQLNSRSQHHR